MDDLTQFENRLQVRVRAFALSGLRPVDSAAIAQAVIGNRERTWLPDLGLGASWRQRIDRRALAALAAVLSVAVIAAIILPRLQQGLLVGTSPSPSPIPTASPPPTPPRLGLAYANDEGIWTAAWDGTNPIRIAADDTSDPCGAIRSNLGITSVDGRYIAYRSEWSDDCQGWIHIVDAAGLPVGKFPGMGWDISWSPDSTHIVTWLEFYRTIAVYSIDGEFEATLDGSSIYAGSGDVDPWWSPDGAPSILTRAWEHPIDGSEPRVILAPDPRSFATAARQFRNLVAYSPDTARAVVVDRGRAVGGDALIVMNADGSDSSVLSVAEPNTHRNAVRWSPTKEQIAFTETEQPGGTASALKVIDIETGAITTLATTEPPGSLIMIGFSMDGALLMYSVIEGEASSIWIARTDGSGAQKVIEGSSIAGWVVLP